VKGCLSTMGGGWNSTEQDPGVQTGDPGGGTLCLLDLFVARGWLYSLHRLYARK
jgi:hypothetical protein